MSPKVANARFYYKAYGLTPSNSPFTTAGPVEALDAKEALDTVLALSQAWNARIIQSLSVYPVDINGEVSEDPDIVHVGGTGRALVPLPKAESSHSVRNTALDVYKEASWLDEVEVESSFATVKYNEEKSA